MSDERTRRPRDRSARRGAAAGPWTPALVALGYLTRLPAGQAARSADAAGMGRAAAWFPVVGLLVGGVGAGVRALAGTVLNPAPAVVLALAAMVVVTGGRQAHGLADSADAVGAHVAPERRLEILRDPRVSAYGAVAIALSVVLAVVLLDPLEAGDAARSLVVAQVVGRWTMLPLAATVPSARSGGAGALLRVGPGALAFGTVVAVATALVAGGVVGGLIALVVAAVVTAVVGLVARRSLGGLTADVLGASATLAGLGALCVVATRLLG